MRRALAILTLAACSRPTKSAAPPSVEFEVSEIELEVVQPRRAKDEAGARQDAIDQARADSVMRVPADTATPTLDKTSIRAGVKRRLTEIQICYEKALLDNAALAGTTLVEFTIGADGAVREASGHGFDAAVDPCVAGVIKTITFPRPAGKQLVVKYPFSFKPAS